MLEVTFVGEARMEEKDLEAEGEEDVLGEKGAGGGRAERGYDGRGRSASG